MWTYNAAACKFDEFRNISEDQLQPKVGCGREWLCVMPPKIIFRSSIRSYLVNIITKGRKMTFCAGHLPHAITLLSMPGKTFANRAIPAMHYHCRPRQAGYMPGRSTKNHIATKKHGSSITYKTPTNQLYIVQGRLPGLAIYSGLRQIILRTPSTPSAGQYPLEPLARDGAIISQMQEKVNPDIS